MQKLELDLFLPKLLWEGHLETSGWKQEAHGWGCWEESFPGKDNSHTHILFFILKGERFNMTLWGLYNWKSSSLAVHWCAYWMMVFDWCAIPWLRIKDFWGEGNLNLDNLYHDKLDKHRQPALRVFSVHFLKPEWCLVESWALIKHKEFPILLGSKFWCLSHLFFRNSALWMGGSKKTTDDCCFAVKLHSMYLCFCLQLCTALRVGWRSFILQWIVVKKDSYNLSRCDRE